MYLNVFMGSEINDYVYRNSLGSTFPGHFLPTDPNVGENSYGWSTTASGADRKFGNFDEIAPPVPSNWEIHIPWSAPGNEDVRLFVFTDFFGVSQSMHRTLGGMKLGETATISK